MMTLATAILLAHALVPHHHHDNIACFASPAEEHQHDCCDTHEDHAKDHEDHDEGEACLLSDLLAVVPHYYKQGELNKETELFINSLLVLNTIVCGLSHDKTPLSPEAFRQQPYLLASFEMFLSQSMGLRAPPRC